MTVIARQVGSVSDRSNFITDGLTIRPAEHDHATAARMFGQVNETEFDLRFTLFGVPVRVHPGFWIVGLLMGRSAFQHEHPLPMIGIWIGVLFVSILVHEMGHALAVRRCGWQPHVVLYYMGGYAAYVPTWNNTHWRSIFISFAGPGAGFLLYGLVLLFEYWYMREHGGRDVFVRDAIRQLKWINLLWGLVNLLPVLPLDGGQISREVFHLARVRDPVDWSLKIGMVVSGGVAAYFLVNKDLYGFYPAILFGVLCFFNVQMYQQHRSGGGYW
jgi:Zn-dependent protease